MFFAEPMLMLFALVIAACATGLFSGVNLTDLTNFMKAYPSGRITPSEILEFPLLMALRGRVNTEKFVAGTNVEQLMKIKRPFTGRPFYENADLPLPKSIEYAKNLIPMRELIATAGVTKQAMDFATGGDAAWGNVVQVALSDLDDDFNWLLEMSLIGNGRGNLARIVSASNNAGVTTIVLDNTYHDFGWENVAMLKAGMEIEIYASNLVTQRLGAASVAHWEVIATTFGNRHNGAATTGSLTVADDGTLSGVIADNDVVYLYEARSSGVVQPMPQGILAFVQGSGDHYTGAAALATFQSVTRASYGMLQGRVYDAVDFAGGVVGVPDDWDVSVITDAILDVRRGAGKGVIDLILVSPQLGLAMSRRNRLDNSVTVAVASAEGSFSGPIVGAQMAGMFIGPKGERIPVFPVETIPANCLYGITTQDLLWHVKGAFDFLRPTGDVWMKSPADRKVNFEAPFGGYMQLSSSRNDNQFLIMDLRTDV